MTTAAVTAVVVWARGLAASIGVDLDAEAPLDRRVFLDLAEALIDTGVTDTYVDLVLTAGFDWQVAEFVRWDRVRHAHSANEVKCFVVRQIAGLQHTREAFDAAVANF